jgi:tetratricopeptide (TPR) repeat protein
MYKEALEIRRRLAQDNPQVYEPNLAETLYNLALLSGKIKLYDNAVAKYEEALVIYRRLAKTNPQTYNSKVANILGSQSYYAIFLKQFTESEQFAREGITMDSTMHFIYTNLAAALLFQGKYAAAEAIYRQYKNELKESFLDDFEQFSEAGVIPEERKEDVEKIKMMLNE